MKPLLLHYYVTMRCNARCTFCTIWKEPPGEDARFEEVSANLQDARRAGCKFVDFTGGEPLLNPRLPDFLREAKRLGYITSVTTNCLLFPKRAGELAGLVDLLHFSLDADTAELHDELRGRRSFDSVIESIDIALKNRLVPDLLFTYTGKNIDSFDGVYQLARKKRLMIILDPVFATEGPDELGIEVHRKAAALAKRPGVYLNRAHLRLRAAGGNHVDAPLCRAVDSTIVILPDNRLALPCFHHWFEAIPLAGGLDKALASPAWKDAALHQGRYPFCEACHINCYFDPSYSYLRNRYFLDSMAAKARYAVRKHILDKGCRGKR